MSLPVFIDLGVPDQCKELRAYLKSLDAEISEENSESGLLVDIIALIEAGTAVWKDIPSDGELEMVFSGIVSLMLIESADKIESAVLLLCEKLNKMPVSDKRTGCRLKILNILFSGLEVKCPLRYQIYSTMVKLAGQADLLSMVPTELSQIKQWITEWSINTSQVQSLYRAVHQALIQAKSSESAGKIMLELLGTYTEDNASQARDDAHRSIVSCLADPGTYLLDHLLSLKPVKFLEGEPIHDLLTIFVSGRLAHYQQFYQSNTEFINSLGLSHEQNTRKMRLLTFMQMAENKKEIEFSLIQQEMQIEEDEVEEFIIDVLRTRSVRAKIDHMQKRVLVSNTTHRTFGRQQWLIVRQHLQHRQASLRQVQASLKSLSIIQNQQAAGQ